MTDKIPLIDRLITYSFYAIFAITPLVMFPTTYEIFEFNKMWFVFGMSLIIAFLWGTKMILSRKIEIKRSPLDIPILIFLVSQIITTIFSIDPYVSWWGYYSRFNGGLLSTITYIFLYFALTTHVYMSKKSTSTPLSIKILLMSLLGGIVVALWGLPSHFGLDPTCLAFGRGLSTECWTDAFKPTIRIFSTLGQPNWLAAYLAFLIPIGIAFASIVSKPDGPQIPFMEKLKLVTRQRMQLFFAVTVILLFIDLLYTRSKSGYIGFWLGMGVMLVLYFVPILYRKKFNIKKITTYPTRQTAIVLTATLILLTWVIGVPLGGFEKYTLQGIIEKTQTPSEQQPSVQNPVTGDALGGTDSGDIRLIVWEGAVDMIRDYPLTGSGPETFGYIYYKYRPTEHNMTSEWDFLYNKAHNEYLNYAATSGLFGLLSYLTLIGTFIISALFALRRKSEFKLVALALLGGYTSILISNFFGFSVVNTNILLFLTPALFYDILKPKTNEKTLTLLRGKDAPPSTTSFILISLLAIIMLVFQFKLLRMWSADQKYALGANLNKVGEIIAANEALEAAVNIRPQEDLFKNELSVNLATLAYATQLEDNTAQAAQLAERAAQLSNEVVQNHPYNLVFFKTRTRAMYALSHVNDSYMQEAIAAIEHAKKLAPTDAKVSYNVGIVYSQTGMLDRALEEFARTTELKPDYRDPYYATALVGIQAAEDALAGEQSNPEKSEKYRQIARDALTTLLEQNPQDTEARDLLNSIQK